MPATFKTTKSYYVVKLSHPTNYHSKPSYVVCVTYTIREEEDGGRILTRYCDCPELGCSRDYVVLPWEAKNKKINCDKHAIALFLSEHQCRVISARATTRK